MSPIVKADVKDPPMYRGDGTDKYSIQEWIEMVETFMHKRDLPQSEQAEEVLSHLLGESKEHCQSGVEK